MFRNSRMVIAVIIILICVVGCQVAPSGVSVQTERSLQVTPGVFVMHDWQNLDWAEEKPSWVPVGSWMWWAWRQMHVGPGQYDWSAVDNYLSKAAAMGKPVAVSVQVFPDLNADATPLWVYQKIGQGSWQSCPSGCSCYAYPRWGDSAWEGYFAELVEAFGRRYDGDPRIHSVWICTGLYGETVASKSVSVGGKTCAYDFSGHGFVRWAHKTLAAYRSAFVKTPLFVISTGTMDRREFALEAAAMGVGVKHNALGPDLPNHTRRGGTGLIDVENLVSDTVPIAFEHFFAKNQEQTYWAILAGLSHGMAVLDLPLEYLDLLASLDTLHGNMWKFMLSQLGFQRDVVNAPGIWAAFRGTQYPCVGNYWDCGDPRVVWAYGKWKAEGVEGYGRLTAGWNAAPANVRNSIYGAYGIGYVKQRAAVSPDPDWGARKAEMWLVYYDGSQEIALSYGGKDYKVRSEGSESWRKASWRVDFIPGEDIVIQGPCYVHMVGFTSLSPAPTATVMPIPTKMAVLTATRTATPMAVPTATLTTIPTVTPTETSVYAELVSRVATLEAIVEKIRMVLK